ncbi:MAG: hypothetical protein ASARMPREDX12_006105 [Alectoria sarmentosa]|nr:MAG: hypothetical protein ASARMPREDX12_006105 [Alectoria sarmentosa]
MTDPQDEGHELFGISKDLDLRLPELSTFAYGPIEDLGALDASSVLSSADSVQTLETLEVWTFPSDVEERKAPQLKSWETFYDKNSQEPRTTYVSEGGPQVFDAILDAQDGEISGCVIKSVALVSSLLQLGLGVESVLYRYEEDERSFHPLIRNARISGYSYETFQSLSATFVDYGNKTKRLHSFVDKTRTSSESFSTSVALAGSISAIIATLHAQIGDSSTSARSLLQLQSRFERPGLVLSYLSDIVTKVAAARSDEEILSWLYEYVEGSEPSAEWFRPALFQILASVSKPWLEAVSKWVGLKERPVAGFHSRGQNLVLVREETQRLDDGKETKKLEYDFEHLSMPNFISEEDSFMIFETGKSLRLLESHRPEHPLSRPTQAGTVGAPGLDWHFSWRDMERIQLQAQEYESNLQKAITDFNLHGGNSEDTCLQKGVVMQAEIATIGLSEETAKAYIYASIANFEKSLPDLKAESGNISQSKCVYNNLPEEEIFAPPLSLLPVLSFNPVITSQAVLINRACLRLLFKEHDIRSHFSLLHRYSLFGDGVFASRLSHALFDPEFDSTEGRKGRSHAGISGLKLGSRSTWPPASSELRLALMGILTESYYESGRGVEGPSMFREELPGGLSFAIRDMPEHELQRCMDPDSIEALDFLRLQYRPPSPLDAVITQASLAKYDAVFKLLLRGVRMLFVANQLFRDTRARFAIRQAADPVAQSFRIESHHFVSAICRYFSDGVRANWNILQCRLEDVDKALDRNGTSDGDSLYKLRDFHENMLDRLMFTLILRKRQAQVMMLLEEIFTLILVFARHTRTKASQDMGYSAFKVDLKETYKKFKQKVRVFISVCRGLSERRGEGGTKDYDAGELSEEGGNTIRQLLLDFEMSGFYVR